MFRSLSLSPLSPQDAALLLEQHDLTPEQRIHIGKLAGGHPLALRLAAAAAQSRPDLPLGEIESRFVVSELVRRFLADVRDARERAAVEAASVLRRVTRPLLAHMLGDEEGEWALHALQRMPFVENAADGAETTPYAPLGFILPRELRYTTATGARVSSAMLDFGPGVPPWLNRVIDAQWEEPASKPTAESESDIRLDRATRELLVDGLRKPLTRLEYGVLDCLERRRGSVVSRDELLTAAWGQEHTGSNVVDAVIRTLRKKLGTRANAILTVTGFGYKLVA